MMAITPENPFLQLPVDAKKGVIIHHWDTDGMVSAALLRDFFKREYPNITLDLFVPTITNYYLTAEQINALSQASYDFVMTCDINFPESTINDLAEAWPGQTYIFDHHHQAPFTNVHYYNKPYPACAAYINDLLGFPNTLQAVIAIVGDKEEAVQQDLEFYPRVEEIMQQYSLSFTQLLEARQLIDSNYIVDDYEGMSATVELLETDPMAVLTDTRLRQNIQQIDDTLAHIVEQPAVQWSEYVSYFDLHNTFNILSHATRALSRQFPEQVIVTRQFKNDQYTFYMRRRDAAVDMRDMIAFARELGLNSGGKEDVVGIIVDKAAVETVMPKLQEQIIQLAKPL